MQSGGPGWEVQTGRKDSLTASKTAANNNIPGPNSDITTLVSKFQNVGLTLSDMVALSGNPSSHSNDYLKQFNMFGCRENLTLSLLGRGTHNGKSSVLDVQL